MAITSGLFNSINGDRKYDSPWFALYFSTFIGNGVFPNPSTGLQVVEGTNMTTVVKSGKGWIDGYFIVNDSDYVLQHDIADGVLKRIDRVVMRLNYLTRQIEIIVLKGAYASTPVAPVITRNTDYYELVLADVTIVNGTIQITQAHITDQRLNTALCGIVHGTVNQADTTTIFNQYQSWFNQMSTAKLQEINDFETALEASVNQWMAQEQTDFDNWFAGLQDLLDENVAATLTTKVQELETSIQQEVIPHVNDTSKHLQVGEREKIALAMPIVATREVSIGELDTITEPFVLANINGAYWYVQTEFYATYPSRQKVQIAKRYNAIGDIMIRSCYEGAWSPWSPSLQSVFTSVSNGKSAVANAITGKGIPTAPDAEFATMANNIANISTGTKFASGFTNPVGGVVSIYNLGFVPKMFVTLNTVDLVTVFSDQYKGLNFESLYISKSLLGTSYDIRYSATPTNGMVNSTTFIMTENQASINVRAQYGWENFLWLAIG